MGVLRQDEGWYRVVAVVWDVWGWDGADCSGVSGAVGGGSAELGEAAEVSEGGLVGGGPGPSGGETQGGASAVVDETSGESEQSGPDSAPAHQLRGRLGLSEDGDLSVEVVR